MFQPIGEAQAVPAGGQKRAAAAAGDGVEAKGEASDIAGPLGKALARLVLQHEDMARSPHREDSFVIPLKSHSKLEAALDQALTHYEDEGREAKEKAQEMSRDYMGNP
ncbi:unnamed protein product [Prorocentrum cordatum]|uniref:Uncharacterized protein n=1 Tax=Prorocentrum cordatum TaxID=2364126 RepID=A0ABN9VZP9_9DINO|nr:unnamed protein product [Polarella glacialis]